MKTVHVALLHCYNGFWDSAIIQKGTTVWIENEFAVVLPYLTVSKYLEIYFIDS